MTKNRRNWRGGGRCGYAASDAAESKTSGSGQTVGSGQVRTNFAETAFFYPQLLTNEKGRLCLALPCPRVSRPGTSGVCAHEDMLLAELGRRGGYQQGFYADA